MKKKQKTKKINSILYDQSFMVAMLGDTWGDRKSRLQLMVEIAFTYL